MLRSALVLASVAAPAWAIEASGEEMSAPWSGAAMSVLAANDARVPALPRRARYKPETAKPPAAAPIPPLPERKTAKGAEAIPQTWTPQEIAAAQASCAKILKNVQAVYLPHPPIKEGRCGAAAPIRLISLGSKPQVSFSPPAVVNCKMAAALNTWITRDLQPLAMKHLGEKITKVEVMSDYSCRASTGHRAHHRLSEHAFADALDIGGFATETGKTARVLESWGTTKRDLVAQIAAAKAAAADEAATRAAADKAAQKNLQDNKSKWRATETPAVVASKLGTPGAGLAKRTRSDDGLERITVTLPGAPKRKPLEIAARLGGPRSAKTDADADPPAKLAALSPQSLAVPAPGPRSQFLRAAHAAACRIFGTTLGPEANNDHRNHFHVDMAERKSAKYKNICD